MPDTITPPADRLRDLIRERAESLGWRADRPLGRSPDGVLTNSELARRCGPDGPGHDAIGRYLTGRVALNSRYVSALMTALGWDWGRKAWRK
jgi:hypothetical protein